jgi:hypothetical protein
MSLWVSNFGYFTIVHHMYLWVLTSFNNHSCWSRWKPIFKLCLPVKKNVLMRAKLKERGSCSINVNFNKHVVTKSAKEHIKVDESWTDDAELTNQCDFLME